MRQNSCAGRGATFRLSVDAIASKSELADLMERLARPAPLSCKGKDRWRNAKGTIETGSVRQSRRFGLSSDAPIQDFDVVLDTAGIAIDVRYQAPKDLGEVPINMVLQSLRTKLGMPDLTLKAERIGRLVQLKNKTPMSPRRHFRNASHGSPQITVFNASPFRFRLRGCRVSF